MLSRRKFLQVVAYSAAARLHAARTTAPDAAGIPTLYYMDGYHGGVRGHMPEGCWRDILSAMREFPDWKISLDVEASSWEVLRRQDPQAYEELAAYLKDRSSHARVEMVAGTFAQPYGWAISGESNIRQLQRGLQVIQQQFPGIKVLTYAVQEPCWASCLPQILRSLKFEGAALKDASTAWAGYAAGLDADVFHWIGPDGTPITTVPRYAVEKLQKVYETESVDATVQFSEKCVEHGILHPTGMCFQDLGWPAKPRVQGSYIRFATWHEYIQEIASPPTKSWRFGIEDILVTLPWGDPTLLKVAQQVRSAENRLVTAEKIAAIAFVKERSTWPAEQLREAWDYVLLSQAHDAWITATTRKGRQAWAFQVASHTLDAQDAADQVIGTAASAISKGSPASPQVPLGTQWVRIINSLGFERRDLAQVDIATDPGTVNIEVRDSAGHAVTSQFVVTRKYLPLDSLKGLSQTRDIYPMSEAGNPATAGINNAIVLFRAQVPSIGYATYEVVPSYVEAKTTPQGKVFALTQSDGTVVLESDLYQLTLDPKKGGAITKLIVKELEKDFAPSNSDRMLNEFRGYFIAQSAWHSSSENAARITIAENGPLRVALVIDGQVGDVPYQSRVSLVEGQRRIDFHVRFIFEQDTWIGDPWDIKPEDRRSEQRRSQNDGRWKLQAFFPVSFQQGELYKNAAFDVCRSRNKNTFFQRWDDIKHNIIVNWVDIVDLDEKYGLALLSDHTTAYTNGENYPLALVLAWAWEGGFWWGKHPLRGPLEMSYAIVPHQGAWDAARISEECGRYSEQLVSQLVEGTPAGIDSSYSLLQLDSRGIQVSTLLVEGDAILVRLFNADSNESAHVVSFPNRPKQIEIVELDGRISQILTIHSAGELGHQVRLDIPKFGLRVLKCTW
jgi:alpha-mannosidase